MVYRRRASAIRHGDSYGHSVITYSSTKTLFSDQKSIELAYEISFLAIRLFRGCRGAPARHVGPPPPTLSRAPTTTLASERTVRVAFVRLQVETSEAPPPPSRRSLAASASAEPRILSSTGGAPSREISAESDTPHRRTRERRDERGRLRPGRQPRRAPRRARRAGEGDAGRASPRPRPARVRAALRRVPGQDQEGRGRRAQGRSRREDAG
jgi:hypothetical protein